jgi:Response regulators consisting of a CheY-like receiver domain and a winged-helix DNA-binding domain
MKISSTGNIQTTGSPLLIIADDDLDDQVLVKDVLQEHQISLENTIFVNDGQELLDTLSLITPQPTIILLDLNMPRLDGRKALKSIKTSDVYKHIPVLVFTTSSAQCDIDSSYAQGANSYFTKPVSFSGLMDVIGAIKHYWFEQAAIPYAASLISRKAETV